MVRGLEFHSRYVISLYKKIYSSFSVSTQMYKLSWYLRHIARGYHWIDQHSLSVRRTMLLCGQRVCSRVSCLPYFSLSIKESKFALYFIVFRVQRGFSIAQRFE